MRHMIMLDVDNPFHPEVTLIVNGQESKMSYNELKKLALDCDWAVNTINTAQRTNEVRHYVANAN